MLEHQELDEPAVQKNEAEAHAKKYEEKSKMLHAARW